MTTMQDSGVVDMSGVITSILRTYQDVVAGYQQMVTADPDALQTAASAYDDQVSRLGSVTTDFTSQANSLASTWEGIAYTAFRTAAGDLGQQVDAVAAVVNQEAQRLSAAASLLSSAMSEMGKIVAEFQQYAQLLIDESRTAAAGAVNAFVSAAQQLGNSAVNAAKKLVDEVGEALAALFGLSGAGDAESGAGGENGAKGESGEKKGEGEGGESKHLGSTEIDKKKALWRSMANQPWFQDWYRKTYGSNPDPEHQKLGTLSWFDKDDVLDGRRRPQSAPSVFTNSGWYKLTGDGFSPAGAPLKANTPFGSLADPSEDASTGQKLLHDTNFTLGSTDKYTASWLDDKTKGSLELDGYGTLKGNAEFSVAQASAQGDLSIHSGQLQAGGDLRATLVDANASGSYDAGPLTVRGQADGYVGADLAGHVSAGVNGVEAHVNAFAGAQVTGKVGADVAGIGVGATGSLQAGIGAQFDGQATINNGHILVNWKAGAALGVGAQVGASIDIDVPKVINNVETYGTEAVHAVEGAATSVANSAGEAANAIGSAFQNVGSYLSHW